MTALRVGLRRGGLCVHVEEGKSQKQYMHTHMHTRMHTYTLTRIHTYTHSTYTHTPVSSFCLISSPKALIFGLPFTLVNTSQTIFKASVVHFSFKQKCRI